MVQCDFYLVSQIPFCVSRHRICPLCLLFFLRCVCVGGCSQRLRRHRFSGAGVTGSCELSNMGAVNQALVLWKNSMYVLLTTVSSFQPFLLSFFKLLLIVYGLHVMHRNSTHLRIPSYLPSALATSLQ